MGVTTTVGLWSCNENDIFRLSYYAKAFKNLCFLSFGCGLSGLVFFGGTFWIARLIPLFSFEAACVDNVRKSMGYTAGTWCLLWTCEYCEMGTTHRHACMYLAQTG